MTNVDRRYIITAIPRLFLRKKPVKQ